MFSPTLLLNKGDNYCTEINVYVIVFYCLYDTDANSLYTVNVNMTFSVILNLCKTCYQVNIFNKPKVLLLFLFQQKKLVPGIAFICQEVT